MRDVINDLCEKIADDAEERQMRSVPKAVSFICDAMAGKMRSARSDSARSRYESELLHCLEAADMLMNLHIEIPAEEEETLLAAVLLHIYPENFVIEDLHERLVTELGFSEAICELVETILPEKDQTDEEQRAYYDRVQKNKLALLAVLADRGNIVQQLYRFSTWNAHRYIDETKICFFPMCIYGKEHYHELLAPISVLMGKLKTLIEVSEILLRRYEEREAELTQDILGLREENATIRGIIAKFKSEQ